MECKAFVMIVRKEMMIERNLNECVVEEKRLGRWANALPGGLLIGSRGLLLLNVAKLDSGLGSSSDVTVDPCLVVPVRVRKSSGATKKRIFFSSCF